MTGEAVPLGDGGSPYALPIVAVTTVYHAASLLYCYVGWLNQQSGEVGHLLGCIGYGALTAVGLWCMIFGGESRRLSKRTGADKRTTGYPFTNATAYDKKKDRKQI